METTDSIVRNAKAEYEAEAFNEAANLFGQAADRFRQEGDPIAAAEMDNNRSVALLQAGNPQLAFETSKGTDEVFAHAGDVRLQAMALGNQAAAAEELKDRALALSLYERSAELLKQVGETEMRSYVLQRISNLQLRKGEHLEAVATMQSALDSRPKLGMRERVLKGLIARVARMLGQK